MPKKIIDLAKELGKTGKEVQREAEALGIDTKGSVLTEL